MNVANKKTRIFCLAAAMLFFLAIVGGGLYASGLMSKETVKKIAEDKSKSLEMEKPLTIDEKVDKIVAAMSPAEKIGQMMMIGIKGKDVNADSLYMLHEYHMGGIVLFDRNMESKEQVKELTHRLQEDAAEKVPLFIAVDEEGGDVVRMANSLTPPPAQLALGRTGDSAVAQNWAVKTAQELKTMGINVNFAPVADVGSNDNRSYSRDVDMVTEFVRSAANGYEQENMIYSLKHFPGIGKGQMDSHIDAYKIEAERKLLETEDFVPFRAIIDEKDPANYFIMVSHLNYPSLDEQYPASLSRKIMTGILREDMKYQGLIITDDMEMGAVAKHYDFNELGVRAVDAGADIVLVCHEYEHETAVYNGLLKALQNGDISQERIDASVKRIVMTKLRHLL